MYLKKYQERVVSELTHFFETAQAKRKEVEEQKKELEQLSEALRKDLLGTLNYVDNTFTSL